MSDKKKSEGYKVVAAFEYAGKSYQPGDEFAPPAGVTPDPAFDEFLKLQSGKAKDKRGMSFVRETPPAQKDDEPIYHRFVLPVK